MNLKDFIEQHPNGQMKITTPFGTLHLHPDATKTLLQNTPMMVYPEGQSMPVSVPAEKLLALEIQGHYEMRGTLCATSSFDSEEITKIRYDTMLEARAALKEKMDPYFQAFKEDMLAAGVEAVFDNATKIHYTLQAYEMLTTGYFAPDYLVHLMRYKNPLEVAADRWAFENNVDISDELAHALDCFMENEDAQAEFELDEAYLSGNSDQEQQMG